MMFDFNFNINQIISDAKESILEDDVWIFENLRKLSKTDFEKAKADLKKDMDMLFNFMYAPANTSYIIHLFQFFAYLGECSQRSPIGYSLHADYPWDKHKHNTFARKYVSNKYINLRQSEAPPVSEILETIERKEFFSIWFESISAGFKKKEFPWTLKYIVDFLTNHDYSEPDVMKLLPPMTTDNLTNFQEWRDKVLLRFFNESIDPYKKWITLEKSKRFFRNEGELLAKQEAIFKLEEIADKAFDMLYYNARLIEKNSHGDFEWGYFDFDRVRLAVAKKTCFAMKDCIDKYYKNKQIAEIFPYAERDLSVQEFKAIRKDS